MNTNNPEPVLIAGELADIELPIAPATNWEWLFSFLGWTFFWLFVAVLFVWVFRNSQVIKNSILLFSLQARWRLKKIEKAIHLIGDNGSELALKKQAAALYNWCENMQKVNAETHKSFVSSSVLLTSKKDTSRHIDIFNDEFNDDFNGELSDEFNEKSLPLEELDELEELDKQLKFILFADPKASRETLFNDLQQSLNLAFKISNQLPWQKVLKKQFAAKWLLSKNDIKNRLYKKTATSNQLSNKSLKAIKQTKKAHALKQDKHAG